MTDQEALRFVTQYVGHALTYIQSPPTLSGPACLIVAAVNAVGCQINKETFLQAAEAAFNGAVSGEQIHSKAQN